MIIGIILCFIPLIIALLVFTLTKRLKFTHQLLAILFGLVAVIPISFLQFFIPDLSGLFKSPILFSIIRSLILYGLIEEALKTALILPLPHKTYSCFNFLMLAFLMGLALGCFESVVYFFDHMQTAKAKGAQLLFLPIFLRIFTSDIIHVTCTGLGGLFIWSCRNVYGGKKSPRISILITAILLHGFYDFFAGFNNNLRWFSAAVILLAIMECRIKYTALSGDENATV
ncbi:MAG: PrsW family intramembrane metalloprotease [Treponema sp.]|nr:PrsW family intramembrane metalloprotease [Treponema sp.]